MRLIDADALQYQLATLDRVARSDAQKALLGRVFYILDNQPTVDAEPVKHGRWIEIEDSWGDCHYQCTGCGEEWSLDDGTPAENNMNYCPTCGAKMDGGERTNETT